MTPAWPMRARPIGASSATLKKRDDRPTEVSREYQRDYEAEADTAWRRVAELKGEPLARVAE